MCNTYIIASIGAMECLLSKRCCANFDFEILEMFLKSYVEQSTSLSDILLQS
jgi:hypothetical protein